MSGVPTLILAGEYDPLTPPRYGKIAGRTLRNSDWFQFPAMGHNLERSSPCPHGMMMEFLANPALTPDASCILEMQPPIWIIPAGSPPSAVRAGEATIRSAISWIAGQWGSVLIH